jgi:hypothetical protein
LGGVGQREIERMPLQDANCFGYASPEHLRSSANYNKLWMSISFASNVLDGRKHAACAGPWATGKHGAAP